MDIEKVKLFLRIDGNEEDLIIKSLILASEAYLANSGCQKKCNAELYELAILLLVAHFYENREIVADKKVHVTAFGLPQIITQLKYCQGGV